MVAQFLRLKLRLLGNLFRRSPWQVVGMVVGLLYGLGAAGVVVVAFGALRLAEVELARSIVVVVGSLIVLGFLLLPLVFGVDDTLDPRRFSLLGIPPSRLALGLAAAAFVGVPALSITLIAIAQVVTWSRDAVSAFVALLAGVLIITTCVLGARVTSAAAGLLLATRRAREVGGLITLVAMVAAVPLVALLAAVDWLGSGLAILAEIADVAAWTPLGAAWAAPADAAAGDGGTALTRLALAAAFVGILWLVWRVLIAVMLVTPDRVSRTRAYTGLGWFARMPANAAGAIAARSLTYWGRDARYQASLVIVPIVPLVMVGILLVGGVPGTFVVLLPVPIMCFFLAWSTVHNDVAYDNTAVWQHVASHTRGRADRLGRIVPPLGLGLIVIIVGTPLSAAAHGDLGVAASVAGVSVCVLLAGLGVSSIMSARFPYPAVHPGDSPFAQPQSSATAASWVQALSVLALLLIASPTVLLALRGLAGDSSAPQGALLAGVGTGLLFLLVGMWWGGRIFDRRAPELLAFTMRF